MFVLEAEDYDFVYDERLRFACIYLDGESVLGTLDGVIPGVHIDTDVHGTITGIEVFDPWEHDLALDGSNVLEFVARMQQATDAYLAREAPSRPDVVPGH